MNAVRQPGIYLYFPMQKMEKQHRWLIHAVITRSLSRGVHAGVHGCAMQPKPVFSVPCSKRTARLRYLAEQAFRFNNRKGRDSNGFYKAVGQVVGKRLTHGTLAGKVQAVF